LLRLGSGSFREYYGAPRRWKERGKGVDDLLAYTMNNDKMSLRICEGVTGASFEEKL